MKLVMIQITDMNIKLEWRLSQTCYLSTTSFHLTMDSRSPNEWHTVRQVLVVLQHIGNTFLSSLAKRGPIFITHIILDSRLLAGCFQA